MVRFALLSGWHVHTGWFAGELLKSGLGQFAVVWDEDEKRGRAYAQQFGADYTSSLEEALAREDVDAVMVECPTTRHREVIVAVAQAGKHIFTDKALALTQEDSQAIREAVEAAGVKLAVSMEAKSTAPYRYLRQLIQEGKLGRVTSGYFRRAHGAALDPNMLPAYWFDKSQTGGGVTLDLGCHGLYLLPWLCGEPVRVTSRMGELYGTGSDEISSTILEFDSGAMGTAFTSFVCGKMENLLEILGTEGMAVITGTDPGNYRMLLQSDHLPGFETLSPVEQEWQDAEYPIVQFARLVESEEKSLPDFDLDAGCQLTRIIEGAYRSAAQGCTVDLG